MLSKKDVDFVEGEKVKQSTDEIMASESVKKMTFEKSDDTDALDKDISKATDSDIKPAETNEQVDEVVAEGAVLLGRLDESNKALQHSTTIQGDTKEQTLTPKGTTKQEIASTATTTAALAGVKTEPVEQQKSDQASSAVLPEEALAGKDYSPESNLAHAKSTSDPEKVVKGTANSNQIVWGKEGQGNEAKIMTATAAMTASIPEGEKATQMLKEATPSSAPLAAAVGTQQALAASSVATSAANTSQQAAMIAGLGAAAGAQGQEKRLLGNEVTENGLASAASLNSATATTPIRGEQPTANVQSPLVLTKDNAGEQVAERLQMMMSKNLKHVDIRLDPPELGRMQIRMSLNSDAASVHFTVQNQQTRDLVDQAMPRLREMLAQQGLQLADSSVQQQSSGQQQRQMAQHQGSENGSSQPMNGEHDAETMEGATSIEMNVTEKSDGISLYA
jgi:flagellar hook-length control protein FliK